MGIITSSLLVSVNVVYYLAVGKPERGDSLPMVVSILGVRVSGNW